MAGTEEGDLENAAGELKIRLSNKAKKKNMVRIGQGSRRLAWGFENCENTLRQIEELAGNMDETNTTDGDGEEDLSEEALRQALAVRHLSSGVRYPEIFPGVDMVYPVTIDPVISTPVERTSIQDCHVSSYYSTDNFCNSIILKTGNPGDSILRSYMWFTLPVINRTAVTVLLIRRLNWIPSFRFPQNR